MTTSYILRKSAILAKFQSELVLHDHVRCHSLMSSISHLKSSVQFCFTDLLGRSTAVYVTAVLQGSIITVDGWSVVFHDCLLILLKIICCLYRELMRVISLCRITVLENGILDTLWLFFFGELLLCSGHLCLSPRYAERTFYNCSVVRCS